MRWWRRCDREDMTTTTAHRHVIVRPALQTQFPRLFPSVHLRCVPVGATFRLLRGSPQNGLVPGDFVTAEEGPDGRLYFTGLHSHVSGTLARFSINAESLSEEETEDVLYDLENQLSYDEVTCVDVIHSEVLAFWPHHYSVREVTSTVVDLAGERLDRLDVLPGWLRPAKVADRVLTGVPQRKVPALAP